MKNNIFIGHNAGADLPPDTEGVVIIGHDIRSLDQSKAKDAVFFASGKVVFSKKVWKAISEALEMDLPGTGDEEGFIDTEKWLNQQKQK